MTLPFTIDIQQGVAELVIAKPPVNALDCAGWQALADAIDALGDNTDVRVIVIRADGRGFCAGVDIKELDAQPELIVPVNAGNYATFRAIHRNRKPVIAAVHGYVLGGGIGIAGAADIVLASDCASFGVPEVDRGAMGGGAHLQRLFPVQKVRAMYFTGEPISAAEAYRLGAIEKVVPRAELRAEALALAARIAAKSGAMIELAKEALNGVEDGNLEDKYRWEQGFTLQAYLSSDSAETRRAFVEKRDAQFANR
jgi:enoyl-CoA hydratase